MKSSITSELDADCSLKWATIMITDFVVPSDEVPRTSIVRPAIVANNFELKPAANSKAEPILWKLDGGPEFALFCLRAAR